MFYLINTILVNLIKIHVISSSFLEYIYIYIYIYIYTYVWKYTEAVKTQAVETPTQVPEVFSLCEIIKNTFFYRTPLMTTSENIKNWKNIAL